jgi:hypothetical protein
MGTAEMYGVVCVYEAYSSAEAEELRFFFDDQNKLVGIDVTSTDDVFTIKMEIMEWSTEIPDGAFDIPDGYEVKEEA